MIYVLDRDDLWWRAPDHYFGGGMLRLDEPERLSDASKAWVRYDNGGHAESVYIPYTFIKRIVQ